MGPRRRHAVPGWFDRQLDRLQAPRRDRYVLVFFLLISTFVLVPTLTIRLGPVLITFLEVVTVLLVLTTSGVGRPWLRLAAAATVGIFLVAALGTATRSSTAVFAILWLLLIVPAILAIGARLLKHEAITVQTIFGALDVYLLLGLLATFLYAMIDDLSPQPLFATGPVSDPFDYLYFSFITLTTTGYGDLTAALDVGRAVAVLEALLGQIFLVTLVARLVSLWGPRRRES